MVKGADRNARFGRVREVISVRVNINRIFRIKLLPQHPFNGLQSSGTADTAIRLQDTAQGIAFIPYKDSFVGLITDKLLGPPRVAIVDDRTKCANVTDVRTATVLRFKGGLLNLRIGTAYIEIAGMTDGFRLVLKVKASVLENRSRFTVESLTKALSRAIYLRGVRLGWFLINPPLEQEDL
jgi:hypothetical protein